MTLHLEPDHIVAYYGSMAWVFRYMLDWGHCDHKVLPIRAFTTIIRWFCTPEDRGPQWRQAKVYFDRDAEPLTHQHELNLLDLLDSEVELPCRLDRRRLGLFFASLDDGDLIEGGPTPDWIPLRARLRRPGAAYLLGKWNTQFPEMGPPWMFFMWPREEVFLEE